jgi:hypothetical protein
MPNPTSPDHAQQPTAPRVTLAAADRLAACTHPASRRLSTASVPRPEAAELEGVRCTGAHLMNPAILALMLSASVAIADFGEDAVPAAPDILSRIISSVERSGEPLRSRATEGERTVYYLRNAEYVGECAAPFGPVHIARLFFVRSGVSGQATPPPRGHTFVVFLDREFAVRGRWDVDFTLGRLGVSGSKLLLEDKELFDYAHLPANGSVVADGVFHTIPRWEGPR